MTDIAVAPPGELIVTPAEREQVYRRNFLLFLGDTVIFTIALQLIGPTTVIPDYVRRLTDSEILIALSSQWFEIGWLLPQLIVARRLMRVQHKKWWFVGPNIPVRTLILIYGLLAVALGGDQRSALLILFLLFYGLAALGDGVGGVPWMDLVGSSLDDARRTKMFGYGNALVGLGMLALAPLVRLILGERGPSFPNNYALLFGISGVLFLLTVPITMMIRELPGGKPHARTPRLREYLPQLAGVLREDHPFRAMLTARLLVTLYTLALPFYIGLATERLGIENDVAVSNMLLVQTLGSVGGALIFSWLGNRRLLRFIRFALLLGALQPALALLAAAIGPAPLYASFLAGGAVAGSLGVSFLNWVINHAPVDHRPIYSGLFNSVSAAGILVAPLLGGTLVELFDYEAVFAVAMTAMLAALFVALRVPAAGGSEAEA